jgi:hypothetical protein
MYTSVKPRIHSRVNVIGYGFLNSFFVLKMWAVNKEGDPWTPRRVYFFIPSPCVSFHVAQRGIPPWSDNDVMG